MEKAQPKKLKESPQVSSWASRNLIALIITGLVVGVTVFIAIYVLYNPVKNEDGSISINLSFIGQTLLPLWGTWIGTVLAFYFGKANFEAGTKSYQDAMKSISPEEKIAKLAVKDVMLPVKDIEFLKLEDESGVAISTILNYDRFKPYNRFAVMDKQSVVKYMIHRGLFYQFIYEYNILNKITDNKDKPLLSELLNSVDDRFRKPLTRGIGFISVGANLLDAKRVMDATEECFDVFVTQNGKADEPVMGLLTNNRIFEYAKV